MAKSRSFCTDNPLSKSPCNQEPAKSQALSAVDDNNCLGSGHRVNLIPQILKLIRTLG